MITTIVGFAISMAFLFLMLSAASSAIQEIVANLFRWRATTLETGLAGLLMSPEFKDLVYKQPLIQGLCSPGRGGPYSRRPSYIPATTLALAILQTAQEQAVALGQINTAVGQMDQMTQQNAAMVEETTAACHQFNEVAGELAGLTRAFTLSSVDKAQARAA